MVIEVINDITFGRDTCLLFGLNELPQNYEDKNICQKSPTLGGKYSSNIIHLKTGDMELSSVSPAYLYARHEHC